MHTETWNFEWKIYCPRRDSNPGPLYPSGTPLHEFVTDSVSIVVKWMRQTPHVKVSFCSLERWICCFCCRMTCFLSRMESWIHGWIRHLAELSDETAGKNNLHTILLVVFYQACYNDFLILCLDSSKEKCTDMIYPNWTQSHSNHLWEDFTKIWKLKMFQCRSQICKFA